MSAVDEERRYPQGPQLPIELGDVSPEHQLGPIPTPSDCFHERSYMLLQVLLIRPRVLTVDTAGGALIVIPANGVRSQGFQP